MKKTIYLIRHSQPDFPGGVRLCLGRRTDLGICEEGVAKTEKLREYLKDIIEKAGVIYSSPLKRALETATVIANREYRVIIDDEISELDSGEWDGLDFGIIREKYKDLFIRRQEDMSLAPPGGEEFEDGAMRMSNALRRISRESDKDTIVVIAHSGINRAFLCKVTDTPYKDNRKLQQEYTSVNIIEYDTETDEFKVKEIGHEEPC